MATRTGHSIRSFIHMADVAEATFKVAVNGAVGGSYHISTPQTVSIRELVDKVAAMTKVPLSNLVTVSEDRLGKDQAYLLDSKKIRDELGWSSRVDLDQGLAQTLAWIDANLEVLKTMPADYIHKP